jgi:hypothetical protein
MAHPRFVKLTRTDPGRPGLIKRMDRDECS